jgi:hypothetical protein
VHCFSGLNWGYALCAYDGVRAYEKNIAPNTIKQEAVFADDARRLHFAPPRIRNYRAHEMGEELIELMDMK